MKILVVEDDPRISEVLEYALKADGYEVQTAQRGREAAEMARKSSPGLIVLDVGLPDIDGFEVAGWCGRSPMCRWFFLLRAATKSIASWASRSAGTITS